MKDGYQLISTEGIGLNTVPEALGQLTGTIVGPEIVPEQFPKAYLGICTNDDKEID